jgi:hypothetical protein
MSRELVLLKSFNAEYSQITKQYRCNVCTMSKARAFIPVVFAVGFGVANGMFAQLHDLSHVLRDTSLLGFRSSIRGASSGAGGEG